MNTEEQMVLTVRMDREKLEKFEYVLKSRELSEGRGYTPDTYLSEVIEKEYARMA